MKQRLVAIAVAVTVLAVYALRLNHAAGLMVDDAWYLVLAKSLADGTGYRLVSSATTPIQPMYPPGFPALLSLVFRMRPHYPENLLLLKSVSVAAMIALGGLTYVYLHRHRRIAKELALLAAAAVTLTPAFVFLATSTVMSECVFTLCQLASIVAIHRACELRDTRAGRNYLVLGAILAAAAFSMRSVAIGLIVASSLWLVKERRWRPAVQFGAVVIACSLPWMVYTRMHAPIPAERIAHGGAVAYDYIDHLSMRWAGAPHLGRITAADLPGRIRMNLEDILGQGVAGVLVPTIFRTANESGEEVLALLPRTALAIPAMGGIAQTLGISLLLSSLALLGYVTVVRECTTVAELLVPITVAIIVVFPGWSFRYVLPLAPFLIFYLTRGVQLLAPRATGVMLMLLVGLHLSDHAGYIASERTSGRSNWVAQASDADGLLDWINRGGLGADGLLATTNPGLVYMRTGRLSIASDHPLIELSRLKHQGVRYIAVLYPLILPDGDYKVLYRSPGRLVVIQI